MSLTLVTAPTEEPISLSEAKEHLRVDDSNEDALIESLIAGARDYVEQWTGRALITQSWKFTADCFPHCGEPIKLRRSPLASVTTLQYVDAAGNPQTLATNQYIVDTTSVLGEITLAYGAVWPTIQPQRNAVTITFVAGYGDSSMVPSALKAAMLLQIGDLYMNRETSIVGTIITQNPAIHALLNPYVLPVL